MHSMAGSGARITQVGREERFMEGVRGMALSVYGSFFMLILYSRLQGNVY